MIVSLYEYTSGFKKFKEKFPSKEKLYSLLTGKKVNDKDYEHVLKVWDRSEMKIIKYYHGLYIKYDVTLLAVSFEKLRNSSLNS